MGRGSCPRAHPAGGSRAAGRTARPSGRGLLRRSDGPARGAPGRPEVDQHGPVGLQDLGVERGVGDGAGGQGGLHGSVRVLVRIGGMRWCSVVGSLPAPTKGSADSPTAPGRCATTPGNSVRVMRSVGTAMGTRTSSPARRAGNDRYVDRRRGPPACTRPVDRLQDVVGVGAVQVRHDGGRLLPRRSPPCTPRPRWPMWGALSGARCAAASRGCLVVRADVGF